MELLREKESGIHAISANIEYNDIDLDWQDGGLSHFCLPVRELFWTLNWTKIIEWPERSPDLALPDFFWGYVKGQVYLTKPNNFQELQLPLLYIKLE